MKIDDKTSKTLLQSKPPDIDIKKKVDDVKKIKELNSNLLSEKAKPIIKSVSINSEKIEKLENIGKIKKKILKPVEHPILLNTKNISINNTINLKNKTDAGESKAVDLNYENKYSHRSENILDKYAVPYEDKAIKISNKEPKKNSYLSTTTDFNTLISSQKGDSSESFKDNPLMNISDSNFNQEANNSKSKWKFDLNLLDDSGFRKTHIIKEKLEIDYIPDKRINSDIANKIFSYSQNLNKLEARENNSNKPKNINSMTYIEIKKEGDENFNSFNGVDYNNQIGINNLASKADQVAKQSFEEVEKIAKFLKNINLEKLLDKFLDNGYGTLEKIIQEITDEKLKNLMIPYGHRIKILKKIKEIKQSISNETLKEKKLLIKEDKPLSQIKYHELPKELDTNSQKSLNLSIHSKYKKENSMSTKTNDYSNNNNQPNFEEKQRRLFHEAVINFVNENMPKYEGDGQYIINIKEENAADNNQTEIISISEAGVGTQSLKEEKTSPQNNDKLNISKTSSYKDSNTEINYNNMNNSNIYSDSKKSGTYADSRTIKNFEAKDDLNKNIPSYNNINAFLSDDPMKNFLPPNQKKESCFSCFKIFVNNNEFKIFDKSFCRVECKENFINEHIVNCMNDQCDKSFYKINGLLEMNKFFCSENCLRKTLGYKEGYKAELNGSSSIKAEKYKENKEDLFELYDPMEDF